MNLYVVLIHRPRLFFFIYFIYFLKGGTLQTNTSKSAIETVEKADIGSS